MSEIGKITWAMVSKDCSEIILPGTITKNDKFLMLPLSGPLVEVSKMLKKTFRRDNSPLFDSRNPRKELESGSGRYGSRNLRQADGFDDS